MTEQPETTTTEPSNDLVGSSSSRKEGTVHSTMPSLSVTSSSDEKSSVSVASSEETHHNNSGGLKHFFQWLFHKRNHGEEENNLKRGKSFFDRFKKKKQLSSVDIQSKGKASSESVLEDKMRTSLSLNDMCDVIIDDDGKERRKSKQKSHLDMNKYIFTYCNNSNSLLVYDEKGLSLDGGVEPLCEISDHSEDISCILSILNTSKSGGNNYIFTGSHDNTINQYTLMENGQFRKIQTYDGESNTIECLSHYSNHFLISGSRDKTVRLRKIFHLTSEDSEILTHTFEGHQAWVQSVYSCFDYLFSSQRSTSVEGSEIYMWNVERQEIVTKLKAHEATVYKMSHLNNLLISASQDSTIRLWDVNQKVSIGELKGHTDWVKDVLPINGNEFLSCSLDGSVRIWDVRNLSLSKTLYELNPDAAMSPSVDKATKTSFGGFTSMSTSNNSTEKPTLVYLGSTNQDNQLYRYSLESSAMEQIPTISRNTTIDGICYIYESRQIF